MSYVKINFKHLDKPLLMGIVNVSPDSFFSSSIAATTGDAVVKVKQMAASGVDIVDIGGEATSLARFPDKSKYKDSDRVTEAEELARVIPAIKAAAANFSGIISVDTLRHEVARQAIAAGAHFINDQGGCRCEKMRELAAESGVYICVMHMQGTPATMQINPRYRRGVVTEVMEFFEERVKTLRSYGVKDEQIILDPGICFGKTIEHNYDLLKNIATLKSLGFPILIGLSRKSLMTRILNKPADQLLHITVALNALALTAGADIIRVHDTVEHKDLIDILYRAGWLKQRNCANVSANVL